MQYFKDASTARKFNMVVLGVVYVVAIAATVSTFHPAIKNELPGALTALASAAAVGLLAFNDIRLRAKERKEAFESYMEPVRRTYLFHFNLARFRDGLEFVRAHDVACSKARTMHYDRLPEGVTWWRVENALWELCTEEHKTWLNELRLEVDSIERQFHELVSVAEDNGGA